MPEPDAPEPDALQAEQDYIDRAYEHLDAMRRRAQSLVGQSDDPDLEFALARRVALLTDNGRPLCFGRIDADDGGTWYIGRRHVEDAAADPVVIEWRAPVAVPFYRAGLGDPMGLSRRRQFVLDDRTIVSMGDDHFSGPHAVSPDDGLRVRGRDALLAELERSRTGEMLDIVATIQAEQDEVIRAPLPGVLTVQGGPGTGKTAIGLHRAAFLLYSHPELTRAGVLVIGPNRIFLRYIAQVLPALGEEAVVQTTLSDLVPEQRVRAVDSPDAGRVKGDRRMAAVLRAALAASRGVLEDDPVVRFGLVRARIDAAAAQAAVDLLASRDAPYSAGRTALRDRLLRLAYDSYLAGAGRLNAVDFAVMARQVRRDPDFLRALDTLWPSITPAGLVRDLLSDPQRLARAGAGVLTDEEQGHLLRPPARTVRTVAWTDADLPLVDEATELIAGTSRTYGHIVVDEAQDLSPMQVRMLARRCPGGSITVLGDLAQGTGLWARDRWEDIVADLPTPSGHRSSELRLGYRSPGRVLDLASRLLPTAAPNVAPTESIRPGRWAPVIRAASADALGPAVADEAAGLTRRHHAIGVLCPTPLLPVVSAALGGADLDWADADRAGLAHRVTLVPAPAAKGLEFDAVVVVEPALVVADAPRGLRLLYICLTRPTQHLSIVHDRPLPSPLAA